MAVEHKTWCKSHFKRGPIIRTCNCGAYNFPKIKPASPAPTADEVRKVKVRILKDLSRGTVFVRKADIMTILAALEQAQGEVKRLHGEAEKLFLALGKEQSTSQALRAENARLVERHAHELAREITWKDEHAKKRKWAEEAFAKADAENTAQAEQINVLRNTNAELSQTIDTIKALLK